MQSMEAARLYVKNSVVRGGLDSTAAETRRNFQGDRTAIGPYLWVLRDRDTLFFGVRSPSE